MATPFKLKSGNASSFKNLGSSPAKQIDPLDLGLIDEAKKVKVNKGLPKNFNTSGKDTWVKRSKEILSKSSTTPHDKAINRLSTNPKTANLPKKEFDALLDKTSKSFTKPSQGVKKAVSKKPTSTLGRVTKALKNTPKQLAKGGKQILKKGGKFLGGKALGVVGLMGAGTLSASAGNVSKKSEGEQIKDLLTKHKLKGGKN